MAFIGKIEERIKDDSVAVNEKISGFFPDSYVEQAQVFPLNGVVEKNAAGSRREKFNLSLPAEVMRELNQIAERFGAKKKGLVFTAAALRLIELPAADQDAAVVRAGTAELSGKVGALVAEAKAKSAKEPVEAIIDGELGEFAPKLGPEDQAPPKKKRARRAQT